MRRSPRAIVLGSLLLVVATVSVAATVDHFWRRLPDPAEADAEGLFRWLVTREMQAETPATRRALVARLEQELDAGINWAAVQGELSEAQSGQFHRNIEVLLHDWFALKTEAYCATPDAGRAAMIDRQLDRVASWGLIELLGKGNTSPAAARSHTSAKPTKLEVFAEMNRRADQWLQQSPAETREQRGEFLQAVRLRLWARTLSALRR